MGFAVSTSLALLAGCDAGSRAVEPRFNDVTASSGLEIYTPTFGAVFSDIDNDGDDDLIISRHAGGPAVYLQEEGGTFREAPEVLPDVRGDLHGVTLADFDNDGDKDLVVACGGDDGYGPGCPAKVLRNLLIEEGRLVFEDVSVRSGLEERAAHRSRTFLPTTSEDGSRIDLYLTGKKRAGFENRFYRNTSDGGIRFEAEDISSLSQGFDSEGRDVFFDFDRDGDRDLLVINDGAVLLFQRRAGGFEIESFPFARSRRVSSLAVGDLDNDGFPDVFVGTSSPRARSDRFAHDSTRIHFFVEQQIGDSGDALRFRAKGPRILIDFEIKPGLVARDASTIFLGSRKANPARRRARIAVGRAAGAPEIDEPGTYIWHDPRASEWHVVWHWDIESSRAPVSERGSIRAGGLSNVTWRDVETAPDRETHDALYINDGEGSFDLLETFSLAHRSSTVGARLADLNNDGFLDLVAIRANAPGDSNGDPLIVVNEGALHFRLATSKDLMRPQDDLFQSDQLITGFANHDGLLDIFVTNGGGLNPGNRGPYQLFKNITETSNHYVLLSLAGTRSNRDALGAQVELVSGEGTLLGYRELGSAFHRSQPSHKLHFGLGAFDGAVLARVRWPHGRVSEHPIPVDTTTSLAEPDWKEP